MTQRRKAVIAAVAAVTMLIGSASALAKTGTLNTTDSGERGGHAVYSTSAQHLDPDSGGRTVRTRVVLKACDDEKDGYGVVVQLYDADPRVGERAFLGEASDRGGADNGCGKRRALSGAGPLEIQVYLDDGDGKEHPTERTTGHSRWKRIA